MDQEKLRRLYDYDPETGVFLRKTTSHGRCVAGSVAGTRRQDGYVCLVIEGRPWLAHRLAWIYMHGRIPDGMVIDHINGEKHDNRLSNLRICRQQINAQNRLRPRKGSSTGVVGVAVCNKTGKFRSTIMANGKSVWLGQFDTVDEARAAYLEAKRRLHPLAAIGA